MFAAIAPEKAEELARLVSDHQVEFQVSLEQAQSPFVATPEQNRVTAYIPVLKRYLAMVHGYVLAYKSAADASADLERVEGDSVTSPAIQMAAELLSWAMLERLRVATAIEYSELLPNEEFPVNLEIPDPNSPREEDQLSIELFYTALAADLHHEYKHILDSHGGTEPEVAIQQEREADAHAANWLLSGLDEVEDENLVTKRLLGIVLSNLYEVFMKLEGHENDDFHPRLMDRLRDSLNSIVVGPDHAVWAFTKNALLLHLSLTNRPIQYELPTTPASHREVTEYLLTVFEQGNQ